MIFFFFKEEKKIEILSVMRLQREHAFCHKCLLHSSPSTPSSAAGLWRARKRQQCDGAQWGAARHTASTRKELHGVTFICLEQEEKV